MNSAVKPNAFQTTMVAFSALAYCFLLYFHAATSSLDDHYQPGIYTLRFWLNPGGFLCIVTLFAAISRSIAPAQVAASTSFCAILICFFMLAFVALHSGNHSTWAFSQDRNLEATINTSLFQPNFSNRSKASIIANAIIATCFFGISYFLLKRRKPRAA